jgi:hypothetical protein
VFGIKGLAGWIKVVLRVGWVTSEFSSNDGRDAVFRCASVLTLASNQGSSRSSSLDDQSIKRITGVEIISGWAILARKLLGVPNDHSRRSRKRP